MPRVLYLHRESSSKINAYDIFLDHPAEIIVHKDGTPLGVYSALRYYFRRMKQRGETAPRVVVVEQNTRISDHLSGICKGDAFDIDRYFIMDPQKMLQQKNKKPLNILL